jgi:hypothetical protein
MNAQAMRSVLRWLPRDPEAALMGLPSADKDGVGDRDLIDRI